MPPSLPPDPKTADRLLSVIEEDILPLTRAGVQKGDKIFGAALLRRADLALLCAATNQEHTGANPIWHGEMTALRDYFALPTKPPPTDCLLLSTHEPCPMCAAATAWCGIPQVYFLFDYADTEHQFAIPHDIRILRALFAPATALNRDNAFFRATPLRALAPAPARLTRLQRQYATLSQRYQAHKHANAIPLK